jgi:hypothetical protein
MTTLQQLAWATHVHHYRFLHAPKPDMHAHNQLVALHHCFGEIVTYLLKHGDHLPESVWSPYQ